MTLFSRTLQLNQAQASYCIGSLDDGWACPTCDSGVQLEAVVEAKGGRALVGFDGTTNNLFVAYRGSEDIQNWIQNIKFFKVSPYPDTPSVEVEKGFWEWYQYLKPGVDAALMASASAHNVHTVSVTGHSAGAACASLHAYDLARGENSTSGLSLKQVVTFGSPRVGNEDFDSVFDGAIPDSMIKWRVTHYHDMVPHVPQESLGFHHVPWEVYYDRPSTTWTVCDGSGEDPKCSNSCAPLSCTSIDDHLDYLNTPLGSTAC